MMAARWFLRAVAGAAASESGGGMQNYYLLPERND